MSFKKMSTDEVVDKYFELLNTDLVSFQSKGDIAAVSGLCKLLALFYIRNESGYRVIIMSEFDIERSLISQIRYAKALSDTYMLNGLDGMFERTLNEITFLNKYKNELPKRISKYIEDGTFIDIS